jgi:BASS family bile acid:Na+ symporter
MMIKKVKPYMMPIAMVIGILFYPIFGKLAFLTPYLIFTMLFLTYSNMDFQKIRLSKLHFILLSIQLFGSIAAYFALRGYNEILAQGAMICILIPTATSAPVITEMLDGNVESLTIYSLLSNVTLMIISPILFSFMGTYQEVPFFESFLKIFQQIALLLFVPLLIAFFIKKTATDFSKKIARKSNLSFYFWTFALIIVVARTVEFIQLQSSKDYQIEILLGIVALFACGLQFYFGKKIGSKFNNTIAAGQSLGQKNTILAIWMSQIYLDPIASIGPGAYVIWQNIFNSYQVWRKRKNLQ